MLDHGDGAAMPPVQRVGHGVGTGMYIPRMMYFGSSSSLRTLVLCWPAPLAALQIKHTRGRLDPDPPAQPASLSSSVHRLIPTPSPSSIEIQHTHKEKMDFIVGYSSHGHPSACWTSSRTPASSDSGSVAIDSPTLCTPSLDMREGGSGDGQVREGGRRGEVPAHTVLGQPVVPGEATHPASPRVHLLPQRWRGASSSRHREEEGLGAVARRIGGEKRRRRRRHERRLRAM